MSGILVAIRNFTIALLIAWLGFSVDSDRNDQQDSPSSTPNNSVIGILAG